MPSVSSWNAADTAVVAAAAVLCNYAASNAVLAVACYKTATLAAGCEHGAAVFMTPQQQPCTACSVHTYSSTACSPLLQAVCMICTATRASSTGKHQAHRCRTALVQKLKSKFEGDLPAFSLLLSLLDPHSAPVHPHNNVCC
eukprot:19072-Heterococcus_DN1.PRE.2